jgi:alpha/beta superfamily hydrolase
VRTENVWITCGDTKLYGEVHIPEPVPDGAILICHGMDAQGYHYLEFYKKFAEEVCKQGFVSLLFDFRGVGKSTGTFDYGVEEQQDVRCALDWLASRKEVLPNEIFVVGHSLGGAVSIRAVKDNPYVKGLVLWSVPKNHDYNVKKFIARTRGRTRLYLFLMLARMDRFIDVSRVFKMQIYGICLRPKWVLTKLMKLKETEDVAKLKGLPILIVAGNKDPIVGLDEAEAVYSSAPGPKSLIVIEDADHNFCGKEDELIGKTIDWLKQQLPK